MTGAVVTAVDRTPERDGVERVILRSKLGPVFGRLQPAAGDAAVIWVFGSGGGLGGPAGGLYTRLGEQLREDGVTSLELDYRRPGVLGECVIDLRLGAAWLEAEGKRRLVLVGHSFGGAVVIGAGAATPSVVAVAALSSQTAGAGAVGALSPRPVIFMHGEADEILPARCSQDLFARAGEPRDLILYPGCRHGLDACRQEVDRDLLAWLRRALGLSDAQKAKSR